MACLLGFLFLTFSLLMFGVGISTPFVLLKSITDQLHQHHEQKQKRRDAQLQQILSDLKEQKQRKQAQKHLDPIPKSWMNPDGTTGGYKYDPLPPLRSSRPGNI